MDKKIKSPLGIIFTELFTVTLIVYLICLLLENLRDGYVSKFFDINILLLVLLVSGIIMISPLGYKRQITMWDTIDSKFTFLTSLLEKTGITENDFYYILLLGAGSGFLIYFNAHYLGLVAIIIAGLSTLTISLLSYLMFVEQDSEK